MKAGIDVWCVWSTESAENDAQIRANFQNQRHKMGHEGMWALLNWIRKRKVRAVCVYNFEIGHFEWNDAAIGIEMQRSNPFLYVCLSKALYFTHTHNSFVFFFNSLDFSSFAIRFSFGFVWFHIHIQSHPPTPKTSTTIKKKLIEIEQEARYCVIPRDCFCCCWLKRNSNGKR